MSQNQDNLNVSIKDYLNNSNNLLSTNFSEQQTSCSDDSFSSHRMSNVDISFPLDLIQVKNVKRCSIERNQKQKNQQNKLRMKRQSSLVDVVTEEVRGEQEKQEKITNQKRRVFPHLKLIFDDGEKSEDSEIQLQIQRSRCKSAEKLGRILDEVDECSEILNQEILECDEEKNQDDQMKLSGFLHVENLIDKQEPVLEIPTPKKLTSIKSKMYQTSQEDIIKEDYEKENYVNEEKVEFKASQNQFISNQSNSPKYRLKVDEIDDDFKKNTIKKGYSEENSIILEEEEKENDQLNDILEKVRQKIEKQESFLKKISMKNDEVEDDTYQSRGGFFGQIEEIENDCEEKYSSQDDDDDESPERKNRCNLSNKNNFATQKSNSPKSPLKQD
ncbi:hypothetical protein ABPG72_018867 [Tetrahymena utriculariae]